MINVTPFDGGAFANTVLELIRDRCSSVKDFLTLTDYFFEDPHEFDTALIDKHIKEEKERPEKRREQRIACCCWVQ